MLCIWTWHIIVSICQIVSSITKILLRWRSSMLRGQRWYCIIIFIDIVIFYISRRLNPIISCIYIIPIFINYIFNLNSIQRLPAFLFIIFQLLLMLLIACRLLLLLLAIRLLILNHNTSILTTHTLLLLIIFRTLKFLLSS